MDTIIGWAMLSPSSAIIMALFFVAPLPLVAATVVKDRRVDFGLVGIVLGLFWGPFCITVPLYFALFGGAS